MAKTLTGRVTSDKGDKTIVITVTERKTHPLYKKQYSVNTKFMAHDEKNESKVGDVVLISETRPISARKHFTLSKILERGGARFEEADATADIPEEPKVTEAPKPAKTAEKETKAAKEPKATKEEKK